MCCFRIGTLILGSISAALSCLVRIPPLRGRSAGSFPEQRLVIEPTLILKVKRIEATLKTGSSNHNIRFLFSTIYNEYPHPFNTLVPQGIQA